MIIEWMQFLLEVRLGCVMRSIWVIDDEYARV